MLKKQEVTLQKIKEKQGNISGHKLGMVMLSDKRPKLVIIQIIDEENGILLIKTNGKKRMENETTWEKGGDFYYKEIYPEELWNVFHWNSSLPN